MKKLIWIVFGVLLMTGCGVGSYSVSGGVEDESYVCFVAPESYDIVVTIDGTTYNTQTIANKAFKRRRNIKQTATTHIVLPVGKHDVKVQRDGQEVFKKLILVSTGETKVIQL